MFGLGVLEVLIIVLLVVGGFALCWAVGTALFAWTRLGAKYRGRFGRDPGFWVRQFLGWVFMGSLLLLYDLIVWVGGL